MGDNYMYNMFLVYRLRIYNKQGENNMIEENDFKILNMIANSLGASFLINLFKKYFTPNDSILVSKPHHCKEVKITESCTNIDLVIYKKTTKVTSYIE